MGRPYHKPFKDAPRQRGFTMVEVVFVTGLMSIIMFSIYSTLTMAQGIFNVNNVYSQLTQGAMQTLRYIGREIGFTSPNLSPGRLNISMDANGNSIVRFQVPVDWDNDGDVVAGNLVPVTEWGAYEEPGPTQNGVLGAWARYSVVNNQLVRDLLDAGLFAIAGTRRVVSNDVLNFSVAQNVNVVRMTLTLQKPDNLALGGSRTIQSIFMSETLLRNTAN